MNQDALTSGLDLMFILVVEVFVEFRDLSRFRHREIFIYNSPTLSIKGIQKVNIIKWREFHFPLHDWPKGNMHDREYERSKNKCAMTTIRTNTQVCAQPHHWDVWIITNFSTFLLLLLLFYFWKVKKNLFIIIIIFHLFIITHFHFSQSQVNCLSHMRCA